MRDRARANVTYRSWFAGLCGYDFVAENGLERRNMVIGIYSWTGLHHLSFQAISMIARSRKYKCPFLADLPLGCFAALSRCRLRKSFIARERTNFFASLFFHGSAPEIFTNSSCMTDIAVGGSLQRALLVCGRKRNSAILALWSWVFDGGRCYGLLVTWKSLATRSYLQRDSKLVIRFIIEARQMTIDAGDPNVRNKLKAR